MLWLRRQLFSSHAVILHVEEDKFILNETEFKLEDLRRRSDFRSFSRYIFPLKQTNEPRSINDATGGTHSYPIAYRPFDAFSMTFNSKNTPFEMSEMSWFHISESVSFIFYPNSTNFKDALCIADRAQDQHTPFEVTTMVDGEKVQYTADQVFERDMPKNHFLPQCVLSSEKSVVGQAGIKIDFQYKDVEGNEVETPNFYATTKSDKGYLSHSKFPVKGGKGSFRFYPLGLPKGETVDIQVGIGKFTDVASITLTTE